MDYARRQRSSARMTPRKAAAWAGAALLVSLADPRPVSFTVGALLILTAWLLRIWTFGHLEKNLSMVTTGPYAHTRNPAYLGTFLILLGVILAGGNFATPAGRAFYGAGALAVIAFFGFYLPRKLRKEYRRLEALFGEQYRRHAANVPDFWPRPTPWRSGDPRRFSPAHVGYNHEWAWGAVLAGALAAMWFAERWSPFHLYVFGG